MKHKTHIVIPAISFDEELSICLKKIEKIKKKNFFVTIVLDRRSKNDIKFSFKCNVIISGKINMSKKRNLAAKKYKSKYLVFFDSDIRPDKNWIDKAIKILNNTDSDIVGGPSIIDKKLNNFSQKITYLSKRSYFVTGYLSFRKYKSKPRFCDWLESCNILMLRSFYLKYGGMNEKFYTGEDKEFQYRIKKSKKDLKIFFHPSLFVFHKERKYIGFLLQRMTFGMDILNLLRFDNGLKGIQPLFPILISTALIYLLFFIDFSFNIKILSFCTLSFFIFTIILIELRKETKSIVDIFLTSITIAFANLSFGFGSLLGIAGLQKILSKTIYRASRLL